MVATSVPDFFHELESSISLLGPYGHVKRAVSHHLLGATLMPTTISHRGTYTDSRIPLMVCIESGHGKSEIERAIRVYASDVLPRVLPTDPEVPLLTYEKPTTRHEQQLLGYMSSHKDKTTGDIVWDAHKGFLGNDLLMFNEAYGEMADPEQRDFRAFMNTALDPYGRNEIFKQNLREAPLRYQPTVSPCVMMQEQPIPADVWYSGSSRRYLWVVAPRLTRQQREDIMRDIVLHAEVKTMPAHVHEIAWRVRGKAIKGYKFNYGGIAHGIRRTWTDLYSLVENNVERVRSLPRSLMFNLVALIYKFVTNYAVARADEIDILSGLEIEVDERDLAMALADLNEFVPAMVRYLDQHLITADARFLTATSRYLVSLIAREGPMDEFHTIMRMHELGCSYPGYYDHISRELMVLRMIGVIRQRDDGKDEVPGSVSDEEEQ